MFGITLVYLSYGLVPKLVRSGIGCKDTEKKGEKVGFSKNIDLYGCFFGHRKRIHSEHSCLSGTARAPYLL